MQVVPDIASFAVDDGFAYNVPPGLEPISIGDIVRVPLGARRVRGYVTAVIDGPADRALREITARSGSRGVYDSAKLRSLRWVATHYVSPLSIVLARCSPPNLPRGEPTIHDGPIPQGRGSMTTWGERQTTGNRTRPTHLVTADPISKVAEAIAPVLRAGKNAIVTAPTVVEAHAAADALRASFQERVVMATSDESPAQRTKAWLQISVASGSVVVGTREVAFWGGAALGLAVVLDEGRRAYKSPQTPTFHVRDVLRRRSMIERFGLLLTGAVPTAEVLSSGVELVQDGGRIWPLVEIVDRATQHAPTGVIGETARAAITAAGDDARIYVLVPKRGGAYRCVRCRELRRCPECDAMLERSGACARCQRSTPNCSNCGGAQFESLGASVSRVVEDVGRFAGGDVGPAGAARRITVGTERDLVGLPAVDLVVVVDPDAGILAPNYRADEDALRLLVRSVLASRPGRGRRALVQTSMPEHRVFEALRGGEPGEFMAETMRRRRGAGFPPFGELIALETDGVDADGSLEALAGRASVLGPAPEGDRLRWLIQGGDLADVRLLLRPAVQGLRDGGARVRVDVDPVDL